MAFINTNPFLRQLPNCEKCKEPIKNLYKRSHGFLCDKCDPFDVALNAKIAESRSKKLIARKRIFH